jgi:hypothetical protein
MVAAAVLVVGACGSSDDSAPPETSAAPTAPTTTAPPPPTTDAAAVAAARQYFLRDGVIAEGEAVLVAGPDLALRALDELLGGPSEADVAAGLTTAIAPRVALLAFSIEGNNAKVDFNRAFETADTQPQVAQVVYTLTQFEGLDTVTFLIDGQPNGATSVGPLTRDDVRRDLVGG